MNVVELRQIVLVQRRQIPPRFDHEDHGVGCVDRQFVLPCAVSLRHLGTVRHADLRKSRFSRIACVVLVKIIEHNAANGDWVFRGASDREKDAEEQEARCQGFDAHGKWPAGVMWRTGRVGYRWHPRVIVELLLARPCRRFVFLGSVTSRGSAPVTGKTQSLTRISSIDRPLKLSGVSSLGCSSGWRPLPLPVRPN